jgi:DNA-binding HxlR family transcriptional regulator
MYEQRNKLDREAERRAQRLVILQLLDDEHDERWSVRELEDELVTLEPAALETALRGLQDAGLVHVAGGLVRAARPARHLSELDLIAI